MENEKNSNAIDGNKANLPVLSKSRRLSEITPKKISWLWPGRIPLGKITLLAGDPGLGKSIVSINLAARVSKGMSWPDGSDFTAGDVIIISAEDDPEDTIRPRFDAAGGNPSRVHYFDSVIGTNNVGKKVIRSFDLSKGVNALAELIRLTQAKLVIIDPVTAYLDGVDSHKNAETRNILSDLAVIAARYQTAILVITHLNKGSDEPQYRVIGSLAFTAVARSVLIIAKDKENPERRLLLPLKNNLAADTGGLAYRIDTDINNIPVTLWEEGIIDTDIHEALTPTNDNKIKKFDIAKIWLQALLFNGPMDAKEIERLAGENNIASKRTLENAKKKLGVISEPIGSPKYDGHWVWKLPDS